MYGADRETGWYMCMCVRHDRWILNPCPGPKTTNLMQHLLINLGLHLISAAFNMRHTHHMCITRYTQIHCLVLDIFTLFYHWFLLYRKWCTKIDMVWRLNRVVLSFPRTTGCAEVRNINVGHWRVGKTLADLMKSTSCCLTLVVWLNASITQSENTAVRWWRDGVDYVRMALTAPLCNEYLDVTGHLTISLVSIYYGFYFDRIMRNARRSKPSFH